MKSSRPGSVRRLISAAVGLCLLLIVSVGCPHRSPVWSPDGNRILLLAGEKGEDLDTAASQLWLVDTRSGETRRLSPPEPQCRFLAAAWLSPRRFIALTGKWDEDYIASGSEKIWQGDGLTWKRLDVPHPNEARATRRLPVVVKTKSGSALVYPTGDEAVVIASLDDGSVLKTLEPAELIGPGPGGGFLVYRPEASDTGGSEIAAFSSDLALLWTQTFSTVRAEIAKKLGKKSIEIVFNEASTSHRPHDGEAAHSVGVTMAFSDVSWREGITAYYTRVEAKTGKLLEAVEGVGISGKSSSTKGALWAVLAPEPKKKRPARVARIDLGPRKGFATVPVSAGNVHGYALSPSGDRFAVSVNGAPSSLLVFECGDLKKVKTIRLE